MKISSSGYPLVSILVPICNVDKYLRQCLDSIVSQTLKDIEIILINDGSKDSSLEIIKEYAEKDSRIVVIDKLNSGYGDSMNIGLGLAKGKYIGIVESDDWIDSNMFEVLSQHAENDKLDIIRSEFYNYSTKDGDKNIKTNTSFVVHDKVVSPSLETSIFFQQPSIWANLYLRTFLIENKINFLPTPGASYQDTSFSFKVYACANRFKMISDAFYHYRIDGGSSSFQNNTKIYCVHDEYQEIWKYVKEIGLCDKYKDIIAQAQFSGYKWNFNRLAHPYSEEFFVQWHSDFSRMNEEHLLNVSLFKDADLKLLDCVLSNRCPKKDKPMVSVIVPVYNMENYLCKCIDSLLSQTLKDIEIICVNDGSTDGSGDLLKRYESKDPRIIIIDKPNGGLSSARNAGLKVAKADYVGFVDSDDWIEPSTYEKAYYLMEGADIVCFGTNVVGTVMMDRRDSDMEYYRIKYEGLVNLTDEMRLNTDVAAWNKLYSLKIIRDNKLEYPEGMLYEDYSFYWKYISVCKKAFFIKDHLYNYLRREGSIMFDTFNGNKRAIEHLSIYPDIYNFIKKYGVCSDHTLISMFLGCFWFAYLNAPLNAKKKVMKKGTKIVNQCNLSNVGDIDNLKYRRYELVDTHRQYTLKHRVLKKLSTYLECAIGVDFTAIKKLLYNQQIAFDDRSQAIATTEWVYNHEIKCSIEKWSTIYDSKTPAHFSENIYGKQSIPIPEELRTVFAPNTELKIMLSLWSTEIAVLQGPILNCDRAIWGTSIFDGVNTFVISVDLHNSLREISIYAINLKTGMDYSEYCQLLKIESRIY